MAFSKRFNMRDVYSMKLYNLTDGKLFAESKTLKMADATISNDLTYAAGGAGNTRFEAFDASKNAEFSIELAVFDGDILSAQLGEQENGSFNVQVDQQYITTIDDTVTLENTPVSPLDVNIFTVDNNGVVIGSFTVVDTAPSISGEAQITGEKIDFFTGDVPVGTNLKVDYSVVANDTYKVTSYGDKFASTYRVVLDVAVKDTMTGLEYLGQLDIPRGKLDSAVSLSFSNDGDPMVQNASLSVLTNIITKLQYTLVIYSKEDLV